jgi:LCP family protein required for cell wall assembly
MDEDLTEEFYGDPEGERELSRSERRRKRRNRRILIAALVMILVPLVAVGGYLAYLNHVVSQNVKQESLLPDAKPPVDAKGNPVAQPSDNGMNYLLVGSDARPGDTASRSDVMVLVHVPQDHSAVQLIHFPRDLWVPIPGHGEAKLNAAYAYGGAPLLVETMQNMLGVQIDHVAMVGFDGFKRMTDAVGGVNVNVEEPSTSAGFKFTKGTMHMNGEMALAFVRERKQLSEGDISRGKRQQAFIKALMLKGLSKDVLLNPGRLAGFVDAATSNLTVDQKLDVGEMRSEAFAMRSLRGGDIRFITAPFDGFGWSKDGQSIDLTNWAKMKELGDALRNDEMDSYN